MDPEEEEEAKVELARLERAGERLVVENIRKFQMFGPSKKGRREKRKKVEGPYFNTTTQEEFDSLAYAAKTVDIIENGDESPLFVYLAFLTKVYPDGTDQKKNLVQRRLQKVCFHFSSGPISLILFSLL